MSDKTLARDSSLLCMQISDKDVQIIKQVGRGASSVVSFLHTCPFPKLIKQMCMMGRCSSCQRCGRKVALCRSTKPTLHAPGSMWRSRRLIAMSGCVTKADLTDHSSALAHCGDVVAACAANAQWDLVSRPLCCSG